MLTHVLIPLDGSPLAETAIEEARRVIPARAHITLLTVVQQPRVPIYGYELAVALTPSYHSRVEQAMSAAKCYLQNIAENLRRDNFKVSLQTGFGDDAACVIVATARRLQVDAIVMSAQGRSGMNRWLYGSVTAKVLRTGNCPVLVVPGREKGRILAELASENNFG